MCQIQPRPGSNISEPSQDAKRNQYNPIPTRIEPITTLFQNDYQPKIHCRQRFDQSKTDQDRTYVKDT